MLNIRRECMINKIGSLIKISSWSLLLVMIKMTSGLPSPALQCTVCVSHVMMDLWGLLKITTFQSKTICFTVNIGKESYI